MYTCACVGGLAFVRHQVSMTELLFDRIKLCDGLHIFCAGSLEIRICSFCFMKANGLMVILT